MAGIVASLQFGKAVALRGLRDVLNVNGQRTDHLKERGEQKEIY